MQAGLPVYGISSSLGSPVLTEMFAYSGIDWVLVDTQHGSFSQDTINGALMAVSRSPATAVARVARNDYTLIGRLLDEGALGIIVPMIDTPEQAQEVAMACRFPPVGKRSLGYGRAGSYGDDYISSINDELFVAVQIESALAVENAEAIMATDGIDGCWIGPADLAASMGIDPDKSAGDPRQEEAIARVLEACRNTGKIPGFAAWNPEDALQRAEQGFQFLTCGIDVTYINEAAKQTVAKLGLSR